MLQGVKSLMGFTVRATDGAIGKVRDVYFDDRYWVVRYVVVEADPELKRTSMLLAPVALKTPRWQEGVLPVSLTSEQARKSPVIDIGKPVSRQQETELSEYFGWPVMNLGVAPSERVREDPNLHSSNDIIGYALLATDGAAGKVKDIVINDTKWIIRYLLADAGSWVVPKMVLISPEWVDRIGWEDKKVYLDLDRRGVEESPPQESLSAPFRSWWEKLRKYF